jgi:hypothetical protein
MPSFPFAPAQLRYAGADIHLEPIRFVFAAAALVYAGGSIAIGPSFEVGISGETVRLDRLQRAVPIGGADGPSMQFQALWQKNAEAVEAAFRAQGQQIEFLTTIVTALQQAQADAAQANQGVATLNAGVSLQSSRTEPVDGLLSATSDGVVTISAHSRIYTTGTAEVTVSVDAGSVGGFAPGAFVRVFYMDAARAGGAVAYQGTTAEVTQTGDTHVVGGVTIPQVGSPPSEGNGTTPPGYVRPERVGDGPIE